jgi:hypothetical protein
MPEAVDTVCPLGASSQRKCYRTSQTGYELPSPHASSTQSTVGLHKKDSFSAEIPGLTDVRFAWIAVGMPLAGRPSRDPGSKRETLEPRTQTLLRAVGLSQTGQKQKFSSRRQFCLAAIIAMRGQKG